MINLKGGHKMSHTKRAHDRNSCEGRKTHEEVQSRRINQLIDLVEKHTRTERHLEQYSGITELEKLKHALAIQESREQEIAHLKELIVHGNHGNGKERENIERNFIYTNRYLDHYRGKMDESTLQHTIEKQQHRKDQLSFIRG
jgi:hypothetical protein